ncbi:MAG TPA: glycosyltransferase family 2 protein [Pirellulales bacterium]|nr:glycosyltransferase family 2 protein [Pirellulales bacterium]
MKSSLSVFFPVFNGQAVIASQIADLLEVLPELTPSFELVVIDDGSTDATCEVVHELSAPFPQVHWVVHPARWGQAAAVRTGLSHSLGEVALMRSERCELSPSCLPKMWGTLGSCDAVLGWPAGERRWGGLSSAPAARGASQPSWSLIRRSLLDAWRQAADGDDWLGFVRERGHVCELEFPSRQALQPAGLAGGGKTARSGPRFAAASGASGTKRPNYLGRIKAFALGE